MGSTAWPSASARPLPTARPTACLIREGDDMRIAQVAPPFETVPPTKYGGTEFVVATLTEELVRRGHDVTLFAAGESRTSARLLPVVDRALWHHPASYRDFLPFWNIVL